MVTALFLILMLIVFCKLLVFAVKAAWGLTKILFIVLFPIIMVVLLFAGLIYLALPLLVIAGLFSLIVKE